MRSSQHKTAEGSTLARRPISSVSNWSQTFQPSWSASVVAMAPAPQPYSRSIVMRRNMAGLVYCHPPRLRLLHQEYHGDHRHTSHPKKPEAIDISQHGSLPLHGTLD